MIIVFKWFFSGGHIPYIFLYFYNFSQKLTVTGAASFICLVPMPKEKITENSQILIILVSAAGL